jgi:hypothetical protein
VGGGGTSLSPSVHCTASLLVLLPAAPLAAGPPVTSGGRKPDCLFWALRSAAPQTGAFPRPAPAYPPTPCPPLPHPSCQRPRSWSCPRTSRARRRRCWPADAENPTWRGGAALPPRVYRISPLSPNKPLPNATERPSIDVTLPPPPFPRRLPLPRHQASPNSRARSTVPPCTLSCCAHVAAGPPGRRQPLPCHSSAPPCAAGRSVPASSPVAKCGLSPIPALRAGHPSHPCSRPRRCQTSLQPLHLGAAAVKVGGLRSPALLCSFLPPRPPVCLLAASPPLPLSPFACPCTLFLTAVRYWLASRLFRVQPRFFRCHGVSFPACPTRPLLLPLAPCSPHLP